MKDLPDILILEKSERDFEMFRHRLDRDGVPHNPLWVRNRESFLNRLHDSAPQAILADVSATRRELRSTLNGARRSQPDVPVILLAGKQDESLALAGLDQGATDYVLKPEFHRLSRTLRRAFDESSQSEQQRQLARELAFHQDIYRSLVGNIPYQIFRKDADGRFTFVNERFARLVGRPLDQIIGRRDVDLFPAELARKYRDDDIRVMRTGQMLETEETNRAPGAEPRVVKVVKVPLSDGRDRIIGVQGMFWDITEQKQAEEQLARQILTINRVSDAILECTPEGSITYCNEAAERLCGHPAVELLGRNLLPILGMKQTQFFPIWQQLLAQGEWRGEVSPADERSLECHCSLVRNPVGEPEALVLVLHDITERRRLDHQLQSLNVSQNLNLLAQSVAHDLHSVLYPVQMATRQLRQSADAPGGVPDSELLDLIERSVDAGAALLQKLTPNAETSETCAVDLAGLLNEFAEQIERTRPEYDVVRDIESSLRTFVGDATRMRQVLQNLCSNACDAMPAGGRLRLSARNVSLTEASFAENQVGQPGDYVLVCVTDSGAGIDPRIRDRIFQPYFTTKPDGHGTGLGLATVSRAVYEAGGFVRVHSQPGRGTRFQIYLPAADTSGPGLPDDPAGQGRKKVLLVDDDPSVLTLASAMLQHGGYAAITASNGQEGLATVIEQGDQIDLIVTDIRMPRRNGLGLVRELRKRRCEIPVLVMTGADVQEEFTELSQYLGVKHFLSKPFSQPDFIAKVGRAMETTA